MNGGGWNALGGDKRVTSGVPNNGTYTVGVRAVSTVDGADYAGPATDANAVAPFGAPGRPDTGANGNQQDVTLSWSAPARNGRDVRMQISIDDGGWQDVGARLAHGRERLRADAQDRRARRRHGGPGQRRLHVVRPQLRPAGRAGVPEQVRQRRGAAELLRPELPVHPAELAEHDRRRHRVQLEEDSEGSWLPLGSARTLTMNGDGSHDFTAYFGYPGRHVRAVYDGEVSEVLTW